MNVNKLSDTVERKFIESIDASEWEVETHNGWVDVYSSNLTIEYEVYRITLESGKTLDCADNHILMTSTLDEVFAKDSLGVEIYTKDGNERVVSVEALGYSENMYDLSVGGDNTYYTNDILSHNTTVTAAYILHYLMFNESKNVAILANKAAAAREVLSRIQLMYEYLPTFLKAGIYTWNKGNVEFDNGSNVFTAATTGSGIRGKSVSLLYIDEVAFIPNTIAEAFFASVYPTVSSGKTTKILMSSTPQGYNHFWKMWNESEQGLKDYKTLEVSYVGFPGRDEKWAEEQRRELGELKFNQEILCQWLGSSKTLISGAKIATLSPSPAIYDKDGLTVYEKQKEGHSYVIVADTAEGIGGDSSAFVVVDVTSLPYKLAAKYKSNTISPLLYPETIYKVAMAYNEAYVLVEINKSEQVAYILYSELEYENLLMVSTSGKKGQVIGGGFGGNTQYGVKTSKAVKRIGCNMFKELVENDQILIPDSDIISEISTFIETKGTYQADDGYHDDLVMCLVLFGWLSNDTYFKDLTNINLRDKLLAQREANYEEELTPFGFLSDGNEYEWDSNF